MSNEPEMNLVRSDESGLRCSISVQESLPCLRGHFPGNPIVPGYILVSWVCRLAEKHFQQNSHGFAAKNVKFLQPVRPNTEIVCDLSVKQGNAFSFMLLSAEKDVVLAKGDLLFT